MSLVVTSTLAANLTIAETLALGPASPIVSIPYIPSYVYTNGTGANQIAEHWETPLAGVTLAAAASVTYTLSAMTDNLGRSIAFAGIRELLLVVLSRTGGDYLTVGDPGATLAHPWTAILGGATQSRKVWDFWVEAVAQTDSYAVSTGVSDQLLIKNSGTHPITFALAFAGI